MQDALSTMVALQTKFMEKMGMLYPEFSGKVLSEEERTEISKQCAFALQVELAEFMQELNWKPWKKTKKPVDLAKVHEELVDCFHFFLELCIAWDLGAGQLFIKYQEKLAKNLKRQEDGY